jgi:hypothetical protein
VNGDGRGEGKKKKKKKKRVNGDGRVAGKEKKREMEGRSRQGGRNRREEEMEGRRKKSVNPLQHGVIFFGAFFCLYVRCQFVSSWQKTPSFCNDRT